MGTKTAAARKATAAPATITLPVLGKGEFNAGLIFKDGAPSHWLVLLPGHAKDVTWEQAKEFAKKAGGELPTRPEQALLFANCKAEFEERWYWSGEQHADDADYAWSQYFSNGYQGCSHVSGRYRARAVRRVAIQ